MVQTRAATKRIESGQALETVVVPPPVKKRRVDDAGSTKNHHRGEPGELCQLNLDVLFLVRNFFICEAFVDGRDDDSLLHTFTLWTS